MGSSKKRENNNEIALREELEISEKRLKSLFVNMREGVALHEFVYDQSNNIINYTIVDINPRYEEILGLSREELVGKLATEIYRTSQPPYIEDFKETARTGKSRVLETYFAPMDAYFEISIAPWGSGGFATIFSDVTDRKRSQDELIHLERQMQQVQKLESMGVLAGGIAHDFNNLLMAILGHADLALHQLPQMSPARHHLDEIEKASRRAADLCNQMLAYSGRGQFVVELIDLDNLIDEMLHLLGTCISKKVILNLNLEKELPKIKADATQLRQVLMNLLINASEAIGDKSGVITISTGAMHVRHDYLLKTYLDEDLTPGLYVCLEVSDTGCGMDKTTKERLFEPFFSTKFTGRGLGMAAVLGIVRGHKGAVKVYSEPGKGTTFKILFPVEENQYCEQLSNRTMDLDGWKPSGTVLLVDDEETIRALGTAMLRHLGFDVIVACDGEEALQIYRHRRNEISIILLDLTMPRLNGEETFRELRLIDPEVRVVLSSGYNEQEIASRFAGKNLAGFIQKPYALKTLQKKIRDIM